jgi:hypothetical protein
VKGFRLWLFNLDIVVRLLGLFLLVLCGILAHGILLLINLLLDWLLTLVTKLLVFLKGLKK